MSDAATPVQPGRRARFRPDRRSVAMLLLSLAAGLPYGAVLGTLNAWLTEGGVSPATIGVFSIITLAYSFKFLWAPAFQKPLFPLPTGLGPRRAWMGALQALVGVLMLVLASIDVVGDIGFAALIALIVAMASATNDIVLDAWRIEAARTDAERDRMSALYQFGYRLAGLLTGFVALVLSEHIGWENTYRFIALTVFLALIGVAVAPEPARPETKDDAGKETFADRLAPRERRATLSLVLAAWAVAIFLIVRFVVAALTQETPPSGRDFLVNEGPFIVILCVVLPALVGAWIAQRSPRAHDPAAGWSGPERVLFSTILDPLADFVARLGWGAIMVLGLALIYRFADAVWGAFAYPFYMGENFGALGHSATDVGVASKAFGVGMTVAGAALGAALIPMIGRMWTLLIGAILAALTNLLFADLALGAPVIDAFLSITHLGGPLAGMADWIGGLLGGGEALGADHGHRMARLMLAIAFENLAGGLASVAIVAYLSSVVNPRYAAVQYALLASLSLLIGTLGRPLLGELIESHGFAFVFILTTLLGLVAVALVIGEWVRVGGKPKPAAGDDEAAPG